MAQHDYIISNQSGAAFRGDLNNGLAAIVSQNSGATQPSTTYAYQWWADTTTGLLKLRNAANSAWVTVGTLASTNLGLATLASPTFTGTPAAPTASVGTNTTQVATTAFVLANTLEAGFRNVIINGNPTINQRGYVSGTATSGANQYTLDRWRVVTSGQSITFTDSANIRTVTAPAGGCEQVVEGLNLFTGTYTLSWTGTATATVGGTSVANGGNFSLTGGVNATLRFSSGTFSQVQIEPGTVATPFERRPTGTELALCQRYFQAFGRLRASQYASGASTLQVPFPISQMRASPTAALGAASVATNASNIVLTVESSSSAFWEWTASSAAQSFWAVDSLTLSIEL